MTYQTIISAEELYKNINNQNWFIFDCRFSLSNPTEGETKFNQAHLPTAQFVNMDKDLASAITPKTGRHPLPDPEVFIQKLQSWGVSNSSQVICYDDLSGAFAARMWWLLKWLGHDDVAVLDGGIDKWNERDLPLETDVQTRTEGTFSGQANHNMWVKVDYVQQQLTLSKINLIDARTKERFTADDSKTDPVPGHVPGAMSYPFSENLSKQGVFLSKSELSERFVNLYADEQKEVISMCGSGITACHNLLAMRVAGLPMARLYAGSWSEWIKEKSRPVAIGES